MIVGRSPGLTSMGLGGDGIAFLPRTIDQIEQSERSRYVAFEEWWTRPVLLDSNGAEFSRKSLVLALANKDGGAHIDRFNAATHALVHDNSVAWVRGFGGQSSSEPMPTPIYASVVTIGEELLLTLHRHGVTIPRSEGNRREGAMDSFEMSDVVDLPPLEVDDSKDGVSRVEFRFESLPDVSFELVRLATVQSDSKRSGSLPAGWIKVVARHESSGSVLHQSGFAGPTVASLAQSPSDPVPLPPAGTTPAEFAFDNLADARFRAYRSVSRQAFGGWLGVREAGWVDIFVVSEGEMRHCGGFAGPQ